MSNTIRIKNATPSDITLAGQVITPGQYYTLSDIELPEWRTDNGVMLAVANGTAIVNDGTKDYIDTTQGWSWFTGNDAPPKTTEGYWQQVTIPPSMLEGNRAINWVVETYLNAGAEFEETMTVPEDTTFVMNWVAVDSPTIPSHTTVAWQYWSSAKGKYINLAPDVCPVAQYQMKTKVSVITSGATEILVTAAPKFKLENIVKHALYAFASANGVTIQHTTITSANPETNTIYLSAATVHPLPAGAYITLLERPLASIGTHGSPGKLEWAAPPTFEGNGKSFVNIKVKNVSESMAGQSTVMINGYFTPTKGEV
jgi:hypothetical protein